MTSQEDALQGLLDYCSEQSVFISPSIAAQSFPGRGLGVYALEPVRKGEKLVHVPTNAMLTTRSIPETFLSKTTRRKFTVHCALAAYLAFGKKEDLDRYQRWMATWPKLEEFTETMPVFWTEDFRRNDGEVSRQKKRRKTLSDSNLVTVEKIIPRFSRSPAVDDHWITLPSSDSTVQSERPTTHLTNQASKIRACIETVSTYFPDLNIESQASYDLYLRFLHMWACVNTRCFYYLRPGQTPPTDSNEAMALCPFQDLFNHSDVSGCTSLFDHRGFFVQADKDYDTGEELFLKYGDHDNDMLWMEYGFLMDGSDDDCVKLDRVIFANGTMGKEQVQMLETEGYKGPFVLKVDGVCYKTIVTSYLGVLDDRQWKRMINGGMDPETNTRYAEAKLQAKKRIVNWILIMREEAEANLKVLSEIKGDNELIASFATDASLTVNQPMSKSAKVQLAEKRKEMCIHRWRQVFDMCMDGVRAIEEECPSSFLDSSQTDRNRGQLMQNAKQFLAKLKG